MLLSGAGGGALSQLIDSYTLLYVNVLADMGACSLFIEIFLFPRIVLLHGSNQGGAAHSYHCVGGILQLTFSKLGKGSVKCEAKYTTKCTQPSQHTRRRLSWQFLVF